jgi:ABC-type sugar transport system ATPase subunit
VALVAPLLSLRGVGKSYGAVRALAGVDLDIAQGETVALIGDNGAGKSTLIRLLSGADRPDEGTIHLDGQAVRFASPAAALQAGIATIWQDLALAPRLSIAQNVFMGGERLRWPEFLGLLDHRRMREEARAHLTRFGFSVTDMDRPVADLSGGQRQAVALARALRWQARIVIMDEPTAALGVAESRMVLDLIGRLHDQGVTILLVSHDMDHVSAVSGRAIVLKRGRKAGEMPSRDPIALAQAIMSGQVPTLESAGTTTDEPVLPQQTA